MSTTTVHNPVMTKIEAEMALRSGKKIRHDYYSRDEYVSLNKDGDLVTEDGFNQGGFDREFWTKYQKWDTGWHLFID